MNPACRPSTEAADEPERLVPRERRHRPDREQNERGGPHVCDLTKPLWGACAENRSDRADHGDREDGAVVAAQLAARPEATFAAGTPDLTRIPYCTAVAAAPPPGMTLPAAFADELGGANREPALRPQRDPLQRPERHEARRLEDDGGNDPVRAQRPQLLPGREHLEQARCEQVERDPRDGEHENPEDDLALPAASSRALRRWLARDVRCRRRLGQPTAMLFTLNGDALTIPGPTESRSGTRRRRTRSRRRTG